MKDKVKLLIIFILLWLIAFAWRITFFRQEERHVPLKYTNQQPAVVVKETISGPLAVTPLLYGQGKIEKKIELKEVKNIFAPLEFYIPPPPPPPPKPTPPPPPPPKIEPPPPHPLEKVLEGLQFMGKATKENKVMVFLTYENEIFQLIKGRTFMEDKLEVTEISEEGITIQIRGTDIKKKIYFD